MLILTLKKCDEQLAFDLSNNANLFDATLSSLDEFNFEAKCFATPSGVASRDDLECCGEYPDRFPFHSGGGERECCGLKVYSTDSKQCCQDGRIVALGKSCPVVDFL